IPQDLYSIVYNLCDNAVKYNRPGGKVDVTITNGPREIRLSVKDSGIGIPEESRERIFERFYRVDKSRSKKAGGTGLGLSIVKHAALTHRAKIELKSKVGEGSEFIVIFPKERDNY
ncbi:MAG: PAS domain-containing sensor histidine kinase, partial [Clostridiales bacterium]|nr:PAS domain-containing sensor histidine kinase [Clostridiales bacterium]